MQNYAYGIMHRSHIQARLLFFFPFGIILHAAIVLAVETLTFFKSFPVFWAIFCLADAGFFGYATAISYANIMNHMDAVINI